MRTHTKKGFTIIELLIAIAIIIIIGGMILANYHLSRKQQTLQAEAQKLVSTLRQAQNMALAGEVYDCPDDLEPAEPQDYGVKHISSDTYELFVDCETTKPPLETITLPENYFISSFSSLIFEKPHGSLSDIGTVNITVSTDTKTRTVSVNKDTGQISLE